MSSDFQTEGIYFKPDSYEAYFNAVVRDFKDRGFKGGKDWACFRVPPCYRDRAMKELQSMYSQYKISEYEISGIWIEK